MILDEPEHAQSRFPQILRNRRRQNGLSQTQLAKQVGLNPPEISHFERGRRAPTIHTAIAIAKALEISLDELFDTGTHVDQRAQPRSPADSVTRPAPLGRTRTTSHRPARDPRDLKAIPTLARVKSLCAGAADSGNHIIHGENLSVLADLAPAIAGSVKCAYIDPPYNTQEQYHHYSDRSSHDRWISQLSSRIEAIHSLLASDGSLWISIDDIGLHYLKVAADAIFGRDNFVATICWNHRTTRENRRVFSFNHEYILVYAKSLERFKSSRNLLPASPEQLARYKNPDNDPRGPWQSVSLNVQDGHATASQYYTVTAPSGKQHQPPQGRCWAYSQAKLKQMHANGEIWWGKDGSSVPRRKSYLDPDKIGLTPETLWTPGMAGTTDEAKKQILSIFQGQPTFDTPKPESLLHRILTIASSPGDLVLDAYLGSGTTAAVCHKMGRKYIGIELGSQAAALCSSRLKKVVAGDPTGISGATAWTGGGGCCFLRHDSVSRKRPADVK